MSFDPEVMTSREAAKYLSLTTVTLKFWRHEGFGPDYVKLNNKTIRYRKMDIDRWLEDNLQEAGK